MLTTNMVRKDLASTNMYDAGVTLNGLSCFLTPDLARDLANDVTNLVGLSAPNTSPTIKFVFLNLPHVSSFCKAPHLIYDGKMKRNRI